MSNDQKPSTLLRSIAIILFSLTMLFTLMGAVGTTCVAFGAENFDSMKGLVPYKPLYQVLVYVSIAAGIWGVVNIVKLVRGGKNLYRNVLIILIIEAVTSGIQMFVSQSVRGSSAPVNIRFYITAFTLIVFLLFRIPPIWNLMKFNGSMKKQSHKKATGMALIVCGLITLSTYYWTNMTHLTEWIDIIRLPILAAGMGGFLCGTIVILMQNHKGLPKNIFNSSQLLTLHNKSPAHYVK